ncbi:hypothetical protein B4U79_01170 [Dinothrombium tinctorium]|uniref:Uncharacterized protein n=1 Tax=Dinothrombium tinctorium TaxID=1965070 RepID=A0A3S3NS37_9ACAR|nr:hypothetical protein B4U79_01170 [Dinothrombium tinctorium]
MSEKESLVEIKNKYVTSTLSLNLDGSVYTLIDEKLKMTEDKHVLIDCLSNKSWTAKELRIAIIKVGVYLIEIGVKKGDVVAAYCPNSDLQAIFFFATVAIGGIYTGCSHLAPFPEINKIIQETKAAYLLGCKQNLDICEQLLKNQKSLKKMFIVDGESNANFASVLSIINEKHVGDISNFFLISSTITGEDSAQIVFSSGTTASPKAILLSHRNIYADFGETSPEFNMISEDDTVACYLPFSHVVGSCVLSLALYGCAKAVIMNSDSGMYKDFQCYKVTSAYIVPAVIDYFNKQEAEKFSLKKVCSIGDWLPEKVGTEFVQKFKPIYFSQLYGASETGVVTMHSFNNGVSDLKSNGVPVFDCTYKIVNKQTGEALGANEVGEILVKSPQVCKGYLNNPELTSQCFDDEGFYKTGDAGYYDERGNLYFAGRYSSLLKYYGLFISPDEIEEILLKHEAVQEVAVVGIDAGVYGQMPKAFVCLCEKFRGKITEKELFDFVNAQIEYTKTVEEIEILETLPKTSIGKIDRKKLQNIIREHHKTYNSVEV